MAAHKYWRALLFATSTPATVELSEFHLFDGATRVDAAATLTASNAPSGALANLRDGSTATGCYWASGGETLVLTWQFPTPAQVTGIAVGSRTTVARYPSSLILQGGDDVSTGTQPSPDYSTILAFSLPRFVSTTQSPILTPSESGQLSQQIVSEQDYYYVGQGLGSVPYDVKKEVLPTTTPRTYKAVWAKVRLERDIDGRVIREQWSDPVTGAGVFENVDEYFTYTVTAIDPTNNFRAVIADRIKPEGYPEPTP